MNGGRWEEKTKLNWNGEWGRGSAQSGSMRIFGKGESSPVGASSILHWWLHFCSPWRPSWVWYFCFPYYLLQFLGAFLSLLNLGGLIFLWSQVYKLYALSEFVLFFGFTVILFHSFQFKIYVLFNNIMHLWTTCWYKINGAVWSLIYVLDFPFM